MKLLKKISLFIGNIFYELSFKWFELCNLPGGCFDWKWHHKILFMVGTTGVAIGVLFHVLAGDEYETSKRQNTRDH